METVILFGAVALIGAGIRFAVHRAEVKRIAAAAEELGLRRVEVSWIPIPPDKSARKGVRYYRVRAVDRDGRAEERIGTASLKSGEVHWR